MFFCGNAYVSSRNAVCVVSNPSTSRYETIFFGPLRQRLFISAKYCCLLRLTETTLVLFLAYKWETQFWWFGKIFFSFINWQSFLYFSAQWLPWPFSVVFSPQKTDRQPINEVRPFDQLTSSPTLNLRLKLLPLYVRLIIPNTFEAGRAIGFQGGGGWWEWCRED